MTAEQGTRRITFSLSAPDASSVSLGGSFNEWCPDDGLMTIDENGEWTIAVDLPPGDHEYLYLVDGEWQDDPACDSRRANPYGSENCVIHV